jgi:hypothetical protein
LAFGSPIVSSIFGQKLSQRYGNLGKVRDEPSVEIHKSKKTLESLERLWGRPSRYNRDFVRRRPYTIMRANVPKKFHQRLEELTLAEFGKECFLSKDRKFLSKVFQVMFLIFAEDKDVVEVNAYER